MLVSLEVLGQILDSLGQQRNLNLGGAGVTLVGSVLGDDLILDVLAQWHRLLLHTCCTEPQGHPLRILSVADMTA